MSSTETARLEVRDVTKRFGPTLVLDGVDLTVLAGQALLLAGRNGSGKTTLLRCIAGLVRYQGRVRLDGEPCGRSVRSRRRFGYLPQAPGLPPWATGLELLEVFGRLRGTRTLPEAVPQGFLPPLTRPVATLSGGQRQRIAIAIALLGDPGLLLMDEPAANLDEDGRDGLAELVEAVRARGASVVMATPSPGDLGAVPDRTVHLTDGRIQAEVAVGSGGGAAAPVTYLRPREVAG